MYTKTLVTTIVLCIIMWVKCQKIYRKKHSNDSIKF